MRVISIHGMNFLCVIIEQYKNCSCLAIGLQVYPQYIFWSIVPLKSVMEKVSFRILELLGQNRRISGMKWNIY